MCGEIEKSARHLAVARGSVSVVVAVEGDGAALLQGSGGYEEIHKSNLRLWICALNSVSTLLNKVLDYSNFHSKFK